MTPMCSEMCWFILKNWIWNKKRGFTVWCHGRTF